MTSPVQAIERYLNKPWELIHKELKSNEAHDIFVEDLSKNILDFSLDFITSTVKEVKVAPKKGMLINSIDMYNGNIRWVTITDKPQALSEMIDDYKEVYKSMQAKHWCEHVKYVFEVLEQVALTTFATLSIGVDCKIEKTDDDYVKVTSSFKHNKLGSFEVSGLSPDPLISFTHMMSRLYEKFLVHMRKDFKGFNHSVENAVSLNMMIYNTPFDAQMNVSKENFALLCENNKSFAIDGTVRVNGDIINITLAVDPEEKETYEEVLARFNEYSETVCLGYKMTISQNMEEVHGY